jgi:hypothetical protein
MAQSFLDREGILIVVVATLVLCLLGAGGYFLFNPPENIDAVTPISTSSNAQQAQASLTPQDPGPDTSAFFDYSGQDGQTVLELLKADHTVLLDSELLLFGSIVLAIDSLESGQDYFWVYYKDSVRGDRSPDVCTTYTADRVRWQLQKRK